MNEVFIVAAQRTPIGSFEGALSLLSAPQLGAVAIKAALEKAGTAPELVQEVLMGNVLQAGIGQAPATQAAKFAGIPDVPSTTVNKVCASGMKAVIQAAQSIKLGDTDLVVAGGMESMSNVPYYLEKARRGYRLGHGQVVDGLIKDGLWDIYNDFHMGICAEICACDYGISRQQQDEYTVQSYKRAQYAWNSGNFNEEIAPVEIQSKKGEIVQVSVDEEPFKVNFDKISTLKPVFKNDGTVTAANASTLNDGAAALVLVSGNKLKQLGLKPIAKILCYEDVQQAPEKFSTSPAKAIRSILKKSQLTIQDIDCFEINEAFSVVALANCQLLELNLERVNINGGAVSLGHPLGASGARIIITLINILKQNNLRKGLAAICNGGGGASAMIIENVG